MGASTPIPELHAWQKAEEAAQTAEQDCVVLYRAYKSNGGPKPPFHLFERARELRHHADTLKRTLWGI